MTKMIENPKTTKAAAKLVAKLAERQKQLEQPVGVSNQTSKKTSKQIEMRPSDAPGKPSKQAKSEPKTIALADLARELNINPKIARAKARRRSDELPKTLNDESWTFPASAKQKLIEFLQS